VEQAASSEHVIASGRNSIRDAERDMGLILSCCC
jgi:hypothetical protein